MMLLRHLALALCLGAALAQTEESGEVDDVKIVDDRPRGERADDAELPPPRRRLGNVCFGATYKCPHQSMCDVIFYCRPRPGQSSSFGSFLSGKVLTSCLSIVMHI